MRSLLLAAAAGLAAASPSLRASLSAVEPGFLTGVFAAPEGTCSVWTINPSDGSNATVGPTDVCKQMTSTWPAFHAWDKTSAFSFFAINGAPFIYQVELATGKTSSFAPITYNTSDPFLGLYTTSPSEVYLVTQYHVWAVAKGSVQVVMDYTFPADVQVAGAPTGGTGGSPRLFVHDFDSDALITVDIGAKAASTVHTKAKGVLDLQYDDGSSTGLKERLVMAIGYQLAYYTLSTGKLTKTGAIPDGPGYPRVNALSPSGKNLAIIDFSNIFVMDTVTGAQVGAKMPFSYASKTVGLPVWKAD